MACFLEASNVPDNLLKVCGERKDSGISGYDSFLTHIHQVAQISTDSDLVHNGQGVYSIYLVAYIFCVIFLLNLQRSLVG